MVAFARCGLSGRRAGLLLADGALGEGEEGGRRPPLASLPPEPELRFLLRGPGR